MTDPRTLFAVWIVVKRSLRLPAILKRQQNGSRMESSIASLELNPRSVAIELFAPNNRSQSQSISGNEDDKLTQTEICGATIAAIVFRYCERDVLTGKLFHVPHYRSIFKNVTTPCLKNGRLVR